MGHIKWKALPVARMLEAVEEQLDLALPFIEQAERLARETLSQQSFPQYMDWDIKAVSSEFEYSLHRIRGNIRRCRDDLPADALARERAAETNPQQKIKMEV